MAKIQDCPKNAQDGPKTSPVRPQEAPKRDPRQPKRPTNQSKGLQDGPGGPPHGSKTARKIPTIASPASLQEAPRRSKDGWRWPGSSSIIHPRSQVVELGALPVRPRGVFRHSLPRDSAPYAWQGGARRPSVHRGSALVACTSEPDSGTPLLCSAPPPVPGRTQRSARRVEEARKTSLHFAGIPKLNCRKFHFQPRRSSRIVPSFLIGNLRCEFPGRG